MDSVRVKSYAKLNLTLCVTGVKDGYHMLDSVVTSVDLYDLIKLKKRKDKLITVTMRGCGSESIPFESNNAVRAAQSFIDMFGTSGADITVFKNIPMGLGLGGSSADSAGVLNGLARLYGIGSEAELGALADSNGSDTKYMLSGGYARLGGRGDSVTPIASRLKLHILLLAPDTGVSTPQCFAAYDRTGGYGGNSQNAVNAVETGDIKALSGAMGNSLSIAAKGLCGEIAAAYEQLSAFDPLAVNMTGSGSGVYALFENAEFCEYAKSRYRGKFKAYCLKTRLPRKS